MSGSFAMAGVDIDSTANRSVFIMTKKAFPEGGLMLMMTDGRSLVLLMRNAKAAACKH